MKTITEQIQHGAAIAFFSCAYADQAEECGQALSGEITEQLPDDTDPAALHAADALAKDVIRKNWQLLGLWSVASFEGVNGLAILFEYAQGLAPEGADRELTPELFGHYLAMQAMGTGVGLESFGYAVRDSIKVPYCEFGSYSLERDYFEPLEGEEG